MGGRRAVQSDAGLDAEACVERLGSPCRVAARRLDGDDAGPAVRARKSEQADAALRRHRPQRGKEALRQRGFVRAAPAPYRAFEKTVSKHTHQTHCIIGSRAFGISEDRRLPLALVTNILGGPCANSLLNIVVREKNGLSYNIEASYTPYGDTGIVAIYFSSDHSNAEQCIELIEGQLHKLRTVPLTARQLSMAKKQFIAQLAISSESNESYMLGAGKSLLVHDGIDTMEQVYAKVRALTARQLTEVAEEVFSDMSRLIYK